MAVGRRRKERTAYERLTVKQRAFVEAYLGAANGCKVEAARQAGYASPRHSATDVWKQPDVQAVVAERLRAWSLSAEEVIGRLSEQARGAYAAFIGEDGAVDLPGLKDAGLLRLVKKVSRDRQGAATVEFHDAQAALVQLGRYYGLFTDRTEGRLKVEHAFAEWTDEELERYARGESVER
jgi:hypothetical protein